MKKVLGGRAIWLIARVVLYAAIYQWFAYNINKPAFPELHSLLSHDLVPALKDIMPQLGVTMGRWLIYFLIATFLGVLLGVLIGASSTFWHHSRLEVDYLRSIPATALIVFLLAAFDDHPWVRNFPAVYLTFFLVLHYVANHTAQLHTGRLGHLVMMQAPFFHRLKFCIFPETLRSSVIAMKQAISVSFLILISIETVVGDAGGKGVGEVFFNWSTKAQFGRILIGVLLLGLVGLLLNIAATLIERRMQKWTT